MIKKVPAIDQRKMKIKLQRPIHFNIRKRVLKLFTSISDKNLSQWSGNTKDDISVQNHF